jgi:hypothetical protein
MFTQMTADTGIQKHGLLAVEALMTKFAQLDGLKVSRDCTPVTSQQDRNTRPFEQST